MKFGLKDVQQIQTDGSRIVSIHPGPMVVRVHEAMDVPFCQLEHRFYLSVDLKFTKFDALREASGFWSARNKSEAIKWAKELSARIGRVAAALEATRDGTIKGKDVLIARHEAALSRLIGKYEATVEIS